VLINSDAQLDSKQYAKKHDKVYDVKVVSSKSPTQQTPPQQLRVPLPQYQQMQQNNQDRVNITVPRNFSP